MSDTDGEWITDKAAAAEMKRAGFDVCWRTISKWRDADRIPCEDPDGKRLVQLVDVMEFFRALPGGPVARRNGELSVGACLGFGEL